MKDIRGFKILRGDIVVYPGRRGSSLWMNQGEVTNITKRGIRVRRTPRNKYEVPREVLVKELGRVAILDP